MKTAAVSAFFLTCLTFVPAVKAITATRGDLILGFMAAGGQGAETNLVVNLGQASLFASAAPGSVMELSRLSVLDLETTFGEDWATRPDLSFGVVGTVGGEALDTIPARTVWASRSEATPGTGSTPWNTASFFTMGVPAQNIFNLYGTAPGALPQFSATPNSTFSAKVDSSLAGSWTKQETFVAGISFSFFQPSVMKQMNLFPTAGSAYDGTGYAVLDLYELRPGSGPAPRLGGIGLNAAGKLVFSPDISKFAPASSTVELGHPTITLNGNSATVVLTGAPAGSYVLERSLTMAALSWNAILTPQSPTGGTLTYIDPAAPAGRSFYRIRKQP